MPTHRSMYQHPHIYPHTCIHARILARARAHTHTCTYAHALKHTRARLLTLTLYTKQKCIYKPRYTYIHKYTHMLTHGHEHVSTRKIYRPTHKNTLEHAHLCVRAHPINNTYQHVRSHTDIQTSMLSITHAHIYILESVCVWVCVCMYVCMCACVFVSVCVVS